MSVLLGLNDEELRELALKRLKKVRDFRAHLLVYLLFNTVIVIVWATTGHGYFWPVFPLAIWGVGLVMNAYDVYFGGEPDEAAVQREITRLRR